MQCAMADQALSADYCGSDAFGEAFDTGGAVRSGYDSLLPRLRALPAGDITRRRSLAEIAFRNQGITFTVYGDPAGFKRPFPRR